MTRVWFAAAAFVAAACSAFAQTTQTPAPTVAARPALAGPMGYLGPGRLPDSLALLPEPPAAGSAALALDEDVHAKTRALRGTPRWALAAADADLTFPNTAGTFSCVVGAPITEQDTPRLYMMLRRVMSDAGRATYGAKDHYNRQRPFAVYDESSCSPAAEAGLRTNGSYPSGHTAIGWAWALVLAEIVPDRTNAIVARGYAFGESRVVCNVHWYSDVVAGRDVAAATVARMHADGSFLADLQAARAELDAARAKGLSPTRDCAAESAALKRDAAP